MPDAEFGLRRRQLGIAAASAVGVVAVVAVVALVVHPWRGTAARSPAARASEPIASSPAPMVSPASSPPGFSEPAFSAAPASSPLATSGPTTAPSTTPPARRTPSPTAVAVRADDRINFNVDLHVSPTQAVVGQKVRVTVTIVNAGGVFDGPVVMAFSGSDPSDNTADAKTPCTAIYGSVSCPITGVRPGRTWSFTFTFIPGVFPAMVHFDNAVSVVFTYTDSHGQQQQTPQYFAHVLLSNPPAGSPPPASVAPSSAPPSVPQGSPASTRATSASPSAG